MTMTNDHWRGMLSQAVDRALQRRGLALAAFVCIPEHAHLLVWPSGGEYHIHRLLPKVEGLPPGWE